MSDHPTTATPMPDKSPLIEAPATQVLTGTRVGADPDGCLCTRCGRSLRAGAAVTVYAYRLPAARRWTIARVACADCAAATIETPTLGTTECLVEGHLITRSMAHEQTHALSVHATEPLAHSSASTGAQP
jgi:hypothetical protein